MKLSPNFSVLCSRNRAKTLAICLAAFASFQCALRADETAADLQPSATRLVRAHDSSTIVKCKGEYWVFCTGRGIPCYHSKDLRAWEAGPQVVSNAPPWVAEAVPQNSGHDFW